jgi:hypothetical protein
MSAVYVIGDIHGQYDKLVALLKGVPLIDASLRWTGGAAHLWFLGDFVDRGPDGIGAIELVMSLQNQAAQVGGMVNALIGNHDLMLLSAYRFGNSKALLSKLPEDPRDFPLNSLDHFTADWLRIGGVPSDLVRMTAKHANWLMRLPAMARVGDKLLIHADSLVYMRNGSSVDEVNHSFHEIMVGEDTDLWDALINAFSEHQVFLGSSGAQKAARFLKIFNGTQIIHGHTPIPKITGREATEALVYAAGRCVNVDSGLYLGVSGFVHQIA